MLHINTENIIPPRPPLLKGGIPLFGKEGLGEIFKAKHTDNRGFTLIELLIVITIIGILSAVAVTGYIGVTKKAARSEAYSNLESLRLLEEQFFAENAAYAPTWGGTINYNATIGVA